MISRPEDRPKAVLLVVAIVAVLVFVVWNLRRAFATPEPVATAPTMPQPGALQPPASLGGGVVGQPNNGYYSQFQPSTGMSDPSKVDPFRSPLPKTGTISEPTTNNSGTSTSGPGLTPVPTGSGNGLAPVSPQIQNNIQLKGIVSGAGSPMAVLKIGDITYNVFAGDRISQDLSVASISVSMVELRYGKQTIRIGIGGSRMAAVAPPPQRTQPREAMAAPTNKQPLEVVPHVEAPVTHPAPRAYETAPSEPRPRPEPKPEPKTPPSEVPAVVNAPRTEVKPAPPAPAQQKPSPELGPI